MKRDYWAGLTRVVRVRRVERDIDNELRFHLESRVAELIASGLSTDDAWTLARQEFGDVDASRRELAAVDRRVHERTRRAGMRDVFMQDLKYALRSLQRSPGLFAAIVLTLALAVGANAAVFSIIDPLFFRNPPGLINAESLRRLYTVNPNQRSPGGSHTWRIFSYAEYRAIRESVAGMARVAVFASTDSVPLIRGTDSAFAAVSYVTADFLPMLARTATGRFFTEQEDNVHNPVAVAVISERFRRRYFGETGNALDRTIDIDGVEYTVAGVVAGGFEGIEPSSIDVWVPFSTNPRLAQDQQPWHEKGGVFLPLVMSLRPGANEAEVIARASLAYARADASTDSVVPGRSVVAGPLSEARAPITKSKEVVIATRLAIVAGIVLVIATANVANLLLARAIRRRRETAVRLALGISRSRLTSQAVVEALVLAAVTSAAALIASSWMGTALRAFLLPRVDWIHTGFDARMVMLVIILTLLAALVASMIPATMAGRFSLTSDLAAGGHAVTTHRPALRAALLVTQTTLSMMLLVGTALFIRSLNAVANVDMGLDTSRLIVASAYFDDGQRHAERGTVIPDIAQRLSAMPEIANVAWGSTAPLYSWYSSVPLYDSRQPDELTTATNRAEYIAVSGAYFDVVGTRLLQGRAFDRTDTRGSPWVMVIGENMARTLWPGETPLGKCLHVRSRETPCHTIIGVAEDVHGFRRLEEMALRFYVPFSQSPSDRTLPSVILVRTSSSATAALASTIRAQLSLALPGALISSRPAEAILAAELRPWRLGAVLFGSLGMLALLVAGIGVYSVVAFVVRQRSRELGVRIALGASPPSLIRMVVRQGTGLVVIGVIAGALGSLAAGRFISSLLFGVSPHDVPSMVAGAGILLTVGVVACLGPAIRATRTNTMQVLRAD